MFAVAAAVLAGCTSATPLGAPSPSAPGVATSLPTGSVAAGQAGGRRCPVAQGRPDLGSLDPGAMNGVQFVSASRGWVVGLNQILATNDGGQHWTVQDRGRLNLVSVDFVDNRHGWAVSASTVLATSDGGKHWRALPEPCPTIRAVHFVSPSVGFAIGGGTQVVPFNGLLIPARGGIALATADGGRHWRPLPASADAQSVCFNTARRGWVGADGHLYRTDDGGRTWALAAAGPRSPWPSRPYVMIVECAGTGSVWGLDIGPGGAASQHPHVGYHASPTGAFPIFGERYFPYPGINVHVSSPGSYPGPFSAISATTAAYIDWCPACGTNTMVPWDLASHSGAALRRESSVGGLTMAHAAAFLTPALGWVTGTRFDYHTNRGQQRIVSTSDGGRTWQIDYTSR
jgi:photosystem II stability/assembly factor-like uncharacterized protein